MRPRSTRRRVARGRASSPSTTPTPPAPAAASPTRRGRQPPRAAGTLTHEAAAHDAGRVATSRDSSSSRATIRAHWHRACPRGADDPRLLRARAGVSSNASQTTAPDEIQASAGERSALAPLLHRSRSSRDVATALARGAVARHGSLRCASALKEHNQPWATVRTVSKVLRSRASLAETSGCSQ
jgi:hypothetical protein